MDTIKTKHDKLQLTLLLIGILIVSNHLINEIKVFTTLFLK